MVDEGHEPRACKAMDHSAMKGQTMAQAKTDGSLRDEGNEPRSRKPMPKGCQEKPMDHSAMKPAAKSPMKGMDHSAHGGMAAKKTDPFYAAGSGLRQRRRMAGSSCPMPT